MTPEQVSPEMWTAFALVVSGCIGAPLVAWINTRRTREAAEDTRDTLGTPDEDMTVVQMMQQMLASQTGQDVRMALHDKTIAEHSAQLQSHAQILADHAEQLKELRQ